MSVKVSKKEEYDKCIIISYYLVRDLLRSIGIGGKWIYVC